MTHKIELSDNTWEQLEILIERLNKDRMPEFHKGPTETVTMLILDRASVSDVRRNQQRRKKAWADYSYRNNIKPTLLNERIFLAGYNRGWSDFQRRHDPVDE